MTREQKRTAEWVRYSNIIPIALMILTGLVQLVFYLTTTDRSIALINQKLDTISSTLVDGSSYSQENRELILQIERRVQRLEDTR